MNQYGLNICTQVSSHIIALISTFKCILYQVPFLTLGMKLVGKLILLLSFEIFVKCSERIFSLSSYRLN